MQVFFIKSNLEYHLLKSVLKKIEVNDDKIDLNCNIDKIKLNKKIKITKEIASILKKNNSNKVILTKHLKEDKQFVDLLYSNQINIITARNLFKVLIKEILEKKILNDKIKKEESEIAVLVNNKSKWALDLIRNLAKEFKSVKIISNNTIYFKRLEESLFEDEGIIITTTNNKRKSLLKANIIINVDFPEELINKYSIYDKANILNLEEKIKINKKRFCGKIINDYEIKLKENSDMYIDLMQEKYKDYDLKDIVECYVSNRPQELQNIIIC